MFNKIQLTEFTLLVFVCCVVIFFVVKGNRLNRNGSEK